jgi:transposase
MEFIGLDIHRHYTQAARLDQAGTLLEERRLANDDLPAYFQSLQMPAKVALEATGSWYHIYELIQPWADEVTLSHPYKTRIIAEARIKTDKVDARVLADLLRVDYLPRAYIAPAPVRELRELLRLRASLVRQRTAVRNKVHAVLIKLGEKPPMSSVFGKKGRVWLQDTAARLPREYGRSIERYLRVLAAFDGEIADVTLDIATEATASEDATLLRTMPGIGPYRALLLLAEIGDIGRFPDAAHLCSYAGLVPSVYSSGGRTRTGPLTKRGSAWLRWTMIEAAHSAIRRPGPLKNRYDRLRQRKPHGTAIADLARFMLGCAYAMLVEHRGFLLHPRGS